MMVMEEEKIRKRIYDLVREIIEKRKEKFVPNKTPILTGLAIYDHLEINAIINSLLDGWFGLGKKGREFEVKFAEYLTNKYSILVNSGSSANLLALNGIKNKLGISGEEIIIPACSFPTTLNPVIQLGFKPAFIDVDKTLNINPESVASAVNKDTRGIMFAHALGNPAKIDEIVNIASENNLFVVEDCCDALGSRFNNKICGSWGMASTFSFYPAHGITLGEGGTVSTNDIELSRVVRSLRDWGKDCWCSTDERNPEGACGRRFDYKLGDISYDHKYIYSQIGYNLKPLELQASMGIEQLKRLSEFNRLRKRNFKIYQEELSIFDRYFELPEINDKADPVFFGLPLIINNPKVKRHELIKFLNKNKIATRLLFTGNALHQPAYKDVVYSKCQELVYSDKLMKDCFWIGIHPGISEEMIKYVISKFKEYLNIQ